MQVKGVLLNFNKPLTMGVLNITGDSFYAGSRNAFKEQYLPKALKMAAEGADILDIGAYSTRPGANEVDELTEIKKLTEAISIIRGALPGMIISADTFRASVAREAVAAGADIINDIGGGTLDDQMFETVAALRVPYILMHMRGNPQTMNSKAVYADLVGEIVFELSEKVNRLHELGVADIIIDPGFGFAKTALQNFELLKRLDELSIFNAPILAGLSRKSMIWRTLKITPDEALNGTTALNMVALMNGAKILRVHDVKEASEAIQLWEVYKG
ncbi:dihydropteroate synthase [Cryomorpha ignava]|uniref:dihydropteroate synthase n=2 Tax=Cryomorpha ignava TaxID=101383 RepID=A0A7K3WQH7_9FLAO|nr:dihydropteroate synthase [Cryomorpha ignava]